MNQYRPGGFSMLPPVVKNLLILNVLFYLATVVFQQVYGYDLKDYLGLHYVGGDNFMPHQFVTYMFLHGDFYHILFNMFALWMFGNPIENMWGSKRFFVFYMICGVGAGLIYMGTSMFQVWGLTDTITDFAASPTPQMFSGFIKDNLPMELWGKYLPEVAAEIQNIEYRFSKSPESPFWASEAEQVMQEYLGLRQNTTNVGASGSVYGILLAFGMMFPNVVMFPIPIKAKWMVAIYGGMELFSGLQGDPNDNVAHFAHLGGMVFGYILIRVWQKNRFQ